MIMVNKSNNKEGAMTETDTQMVEEVMEEESEGTQNPDSTL